jgi:hypothetical protein
MIESFGNDLFKNKSDVIYNNKRHQRKLPKDKTKMESYNMQTNLSLTIPFNTKSIPQTYEQIIIDSSRTIQRNVVTGKLDLNA